MGVTNYLLSEMILQVGSPLVAWTAYIFLGGNLGSRPKKNPTAPGSVAGRQTVTEGKDSDHETHPFTLGIYLIYRYMFMTYINMYTVYLHLVYMI